MAKSFDKVVLFKGTSREKVFSIEEMEKVYLGASYYKEKAEILEEGLQQLKEESL